MTHRVLLSTLRAERITPEGFAAVVGTYIEDLRAYAAHQEAIVAGSEEHQQYPPPWAPRIVQDSVDHVGLKPDYELVDDSPTEAELLRAAKNLLLGRVAAEEQRIHDTILAPGKRRMAIIREGRIRHDDVHRAQSIAAEHNSTTGGLANALANVVGMGKRRMGLDEAQTLAIEQRPDDDKAFMVEHEARAQRTTVLMKHAAELAHEIEDLPTVQVCEAWQMKPFPEE